MPAIGQIWQVTYQQSLDGQLLENVIHYQGIPATSTPAAVAAAAQQFWVFLQNIQATAVVYTAMIVKQMTPLAFDEQIVLPGTATGAVASAQFNNVISAVITKRTGTAGKSHRGRMYIGGIPLTFATDPNKLNTTGATALGTFTGNVMARYGPSGTDPTIQLILYSRAIGGTSPFTLAGAQPVTGLDAQIVFGTQRRRRVGVGV